MTISLTRYLYNKDEVKLTFIECLLKQENVEECYFWIYEYYKTGYVRETWNLLYKIYYDFYALKNPKMETKLNSYYKKWKETNDIKFMLGIVKNLFRFNKDYNIFLLRTYYYKRNNEVVKNNEINDFGKLNKVETSLINAIKQRKKIAISHYLKKIKDNKKIQKILEKVLEKKITINEYYTNVYHQLLVRILSNFENISKKKVCYKIMLKKELSKLEETDEGCRKDGRQEDVSYVYKTLSKRRLYGISSNIGCFQLCRDDIDLNTIFWYHWEYYAYKCPVWKARFDKCKIKINNKKELIDFEDEDEYEEFYEEYGYEPDEQSKEVQEKSTKVIEKNTLKNWINDIFETKLTKNIRIKVVY
jgi:hypothetical protein